MERLEIGVGDPNRKEEMSGALAMVTDALLSPEYLVSWGPVGSPPAAKELLTRTRQT
jgi:hypothetical protein